MPQVVRLDTRTALSSLTAAYKADALRAFALQTSMHIVATVVLLACAAAYLLFMFRCVLRAALCCVQ